MKEITPVECLEIAQDIKPLKYQFKLGDRCSWDGAPSWWNPFGEKIREIEGDTAWLDYWRSPIPISQLILIVEEVEA